MSWRDRLLDMSVVASFDRTGYRRHARGFDPEDLEVSLTGRRALVTGASGGLGLATARALAGLGASVLLGSRDEGRAHQACEAVVRNHRGADVQPAVFDVGDLASLRAWATDHAEEPLDILVHNAGVLPPRRSTTADGHEQTVATNLIGPFALTWALRDRLKASADPRVVWVSSGGMLTQKLDVDATFDPPEPFDGVVAYARTKRAEWVTTGQLQERLGPSVSVQCMHPGWADTPGVQTSLPRFHRMLKRRLRTPEEGADTTVWLAARSPRPEPLASFWFDRQTADPYPLPNTRASAEESAALWRRLCEAIEISADAPW